MSTQSFFIMQSNISDTKAALIKRIVVCYGLEPRAVLSSTKGYRNDSNFVELADGSRVNVIIYKREPGITGVIRRADRISDFLASQGQPTRQTLNTRLLSLGKGERARYANIYTYLPGYTIPWEAYTKAHIKALGAGMSNMHALLRQCVGVGSSGLPDVEDVYSAILDRMEWYFRDPGVIQAMHLKLSLVFDPDNLAEYKHLIEICKQASSRQPLHMDFVRGNILFSGQKVDGLPVISGILDFEKTAMGHPLFDIARTLAFLLVDCKYKAAAKIPTYFLDSGYIKRGAMPVQKLTIVKNGQRQDALEPLTTMFLLHDLYKFLRHNPYEFLGQNEHYLRTKSILLQRKLIQEL